MKRLQVLDCTLRDGGYCNHWEFGKNNIKSIIDGLITANIDIIECGFITNRIEYNPNISKFSTIEQVNRFIPEHKQDRLFVVMMNFGEYDVDNLTPYDGGGIDGIRVAFHKKNRFEALELCRKIKDKGYKVFVQPMVSITYSDIEFIEMIKAVNSIEPYALYIVDSFGMMKNKDLQRLYFLVDNNLNNNIKIGFHSHNNLQLAYSNALSLIGTQTSRELIVDSSVFGMGRGAGNLNTELFVEYVNENHNGKYLIKPLLKVVDEVLIFFHKKNYWGYSLANYLSAKHNAHPNYAGFLSDKNTLTFEDIDEIFEMMSDDKKVEFDKDYIENLYLQFMEKPNLQSARANDLKKILNGKDVLLIAPGKSSIEEREKIKNKDGVVKIAVNFNYEHADYLFVSNLRRFKTLSTEEKKRAIITSNIPYDNVFYQASYKDLLNDNEFVSDNAGMMAIKLFINYGVKRIFLAGFDGYSHDESDANYYDSNMEIVARNAVLQKINQGMMACLRQFNKIIPIVFLTKEKFLRIEGE